jgi:hypothetical protein
MNLNYRIYIVDFFNIFSDFREIKYKKENVDFHNVKHTNKMKDTIEFFDLFFTKYIAYVNIDRKSKFIFIMKKLHDYIETLGYILKKYKEYNVEFMIIEDKYDNVVLDKNKDDFLCQYVFYVLSQTHNCTLVSNDKYRDKKQYVNLFQFDMSICTLEWNAKIEKINKSVIRYEVNPTVANNLIKQTLYRCTIPKYKLNSII